MQVEHPLKYIYIYIKHRATVRAYTNIPGRLHTQLIELYCIVIYLLKSVNDKN